MHKSQEAGNDYENNSGFVAWVKERKRSIKPSPHATVIARSAEDGSKQSDVLGSVIPVGPYEFPNQPSGQVRQETVK